MEINGKITLLFSVEGDGATLEISDEASSTTFCANGSISNMEEGLVIFYDGNGSSVASFRNFDHFTSEIGCSK